MGKYVIEKEFSNRTKVRRISYWRFYIFIHLYEITNNKLKT